MATLVVGGYDSKCKECNTSANTHEEGHFTRLGYVSNGEPGCGQLWDLVEFVYTMTTEQVYSFVSLCPNLVGVQAKWLEFDTDRNEWVWHDEVLPGQPTLPYEILKAMGVE